MVDSSEKEKISIEGTLLMLDDATPHVSVVVQVIRNGEPLATALSDEKGRYRFISLEPGIYQVRCYAHNMYIYYGKYKQVDASHGASLKVQSGKTLKNIDFHFAPFKKGTWRNYNALDGLASNDVTAIYRSSDGIMWFGTRGGISRYDGKEFINITTKDGLVDNNVRDIYCSSDGVMWFATEGGVSRYDGREFVNFTKENGLADDLVTDICCGSDGVMWFATEGGVSRYDGLDFVNFTRENGLADDLVNAICCDSDGVMWFATWGGVSRYDPRGMGDSPHFVSFTTDNGLVDNYVGAICADIDGVMWFGTGGGATGGGISRYDGREFVNLTMEDGLADNWIVTIQRGTDGAAWFGIMNWSGTGGVSRYDGQGFVNFTRSDGLAGDRVIAIHRDPDGIMWFGTSGDGVFRYDAKGFVNFTTADGLGHDCVNIVHQDPDGMMWFTGRNSVSYYNGKEFGNLTEKDGLVHNNVVGIHRDSNGVMWFGAWSGGVSRYDGKEFINYTAEDGFKNERVPAINSDSDGAIWFGTMGGGVFRYDGKELINFTMENGLAYNDVMAIHPGLDGVVWFGTGGWQSKGGGVSRYDGKEFVNFTKEDGLAHNCVWAIWGDPDGVLWFATDAGVSRYDGRKFTNITNEDGLIHNMVRAICRDNNGIIWFGTEGGVSGYDGTAWTSLDARDGLLGHRILSIIQDQDNFLWFATEDRGVIRYCRSTTGPSIHIVSVRVNGEYIDLEAKPLITAGSYVSVDYNSIDLKTVPEKRQYRYRVKEIDHDWQKPTKSDTFDYIYNKPGIYTFEVQAIDRDLNYSEPASVKLEVVPDPRDRRIIQLEAHIREQELAEIARIHQELEDARRIQQSLLPDKPPEVEGFEIACVSNPAREVSGDFYSYLSLGENTGMVLGDVTGKSVKAAMVAAMTNGMLRSEVKAQRELWDSPMKILYELNIDLQPLLVRGMFAAMSLAIIKPGEKRLVLSNAGMPYPILKRGNGAWELEVNGLPLGLTDIAEYDDLYTDLQGGDLVIFCSDGVIEAENETGKMYQTERLLEVIQQAEPKLSAQGMIDLILRNVDEYVGDEEAYDDITIVVLRCK